MFFNWTSTESFYRCLHTGREQKNNKQTTEQILLILLTIQWNRWACPNRHSSALRGGLESWGRREVEVKDRLMSCLRSASDGRTNEVEDVTIPLSPPLPLLCLKSWRGWTTAGWRRIEIDGKRSDSTHRSLCNFLVFLVSSSPFVSFSFWWLETQRDRQNQR